MDINLTSSFILILGPLSSALSPAGQSVCFSPLPSPGLSSCSISSFFFLFVPAITDAPESFRAVQACVFFSAADLRGALGLGSLGTLGALGSLGAFGSFGLAVLLAAAFFSPAAGALAVFLVAFGFGSEGLHSSLSSSLLFVWEKDLVVEYEWIIIYYIEILYFGFI